MNMRARKGLWLVQLGFDCEGSQINTEFVCRMTIKSNSAASMDL